MPDLALAFNALNTMQNVLITLNSKESRDEAADAFHDELVTLVEATLRGSKTQATFSNQLKALLGEYIEQAYNDGLKAGAVTEPIAEDEKAIADLIAQQKTFVESFAEFVVEARTEDESLVALLPRMDLWRNMIRSAYDAGLNSALADQMVEFTGDDGNESCATCQRLKGQKHRRSWFVSRGLVPGQPGNTNFECHGFNCRHILSPLGGAGKTGTTKYGISFGTKFKEHG